MDQSCRSSLVGVVLTIMNSPTEMNGPPHSSKHYTWKCFQDWTPNVGFLWSVSNTPVHCSLYERVHTSLPPNERYWKKVLLSWNPWSPSIMFSKTNVSLEKSEGDFQTTEIPIPNLLGMLEEWTTQRTSTKGMHKQ